MIDEKTKLTQELSEKLNSQIKQRKRLEADLEKGRLALATATRTTREAENALTELTAEQAWFLMKIFCFENF